MESSDIKVVPQLSLGSPPELQDLDLPHHVANSLAGPGHARQTGGCYLWSAGLVIMDDFWVIMTSHYDQKNDQNDQSMSQ